MGEFVTFLLMLLLVLAAAAAVLTVILASPFLLGWRQVRRRVRVSPGTRSAAPTWWLVSPAEPARLHRRLRQATAGARAAGLLGGEQLRPLVLELETHAVELERSLLRTPGRDRVSRHARRTTRDEITKLEQLVHGLGNLAGPASLPATSTSTGRLDRVQERIDALSQARAELTAMEQLGHHPLPDGAPDSAI